MRFRLTPTVAAVVPCLLLFLAMASAKLDEKSGDDEAKVQVKEEESDVQQEELLPATEDVVYVIPEVHPSLHLAEHFDEENAFKSKWVKSAAKKDGADSGIDAYDGEWALEQAKKNPLAGDQGLVLKSKAKHSAISSRLKKPFKFSQKPLIVQYDINFQAGQECGGGYLKLLSHSGGLDLVKFNDKTPYTIMFGPDRCGSDSKLHFIFRHVNPLNKSIEEKHCKKLETKERAILEEVFKDNKPHLFRLEVHPDNSYEISIDYKIVNHGSLFNDFTPPVNPPAEIDDPTDTKPEDWDEREKIPDPSATKPDDWDESQPSQILDDSATMPDGWLEDEPDLIPDPSAEKPEDWDDEMDGLWEAAMIDNPKCSDVPGCGKWRRPMIDNPNYKGKWHAPMINNPNYKGKWKPKLIPNPDYFHDPEPFKMTDIGAVGIELWSMSNEILFDNIVVSDDKAFADEWARNTFDLKLQKLDVNNGNIFQRIIAYSNKNPWLYAVYVVVIGLPLVLVITFCCSGDSGAAKVDPKKTDDLQNDDANEAGEEGSEDENAGENQPASGDDNVGQPPGEASVPRKRKARKE